jgi:hypothetical protein
MQASLSKNEEEFLETYSKICSMKHLITILLFLSSVSLSHAGLFGPSNYEECVLENVKTAQTDRAVTAVRQTCQSMFPETLKVEPPRKDGEKCYVYWDGNKFQLDTSSSQRKDKSKFSEYEISRWGVPLIISRIPKTMTDYFLQNLQNKTDKNMFDSPEYIEWFNKYWHQATRLCGLE